MAKNLILFGILLIIAGLLWPLLSKLPFGRLPGDIIIRRGGLSLYLPFGTSILISIILSLLFTIFRR